jgi:hypothetical protein
MFNYQQFGFGQRSKAGSLTDGAKEYRWTIAVEGWEQFLTFLIDKMPAAGVDGDADGASD